MSDEPKRILINIETQTEFQARQRCFNSNCSSPLPLGLANTLCTKCQGEQNAFSQQEIELWRQKEHIESSVAIVDVPKKRVSVDEYLDNLIRKRDAKTKEIGPKIKVDIVSDTPLKDLLSADSNKTVITNIQKINQH